MRENSEGRGRKRCQAAPENRRGDEKRQRYPGGRFVSNKGPLLDDDDEIDSDEEELAYQRGKDFEKHLLDKTVTVNDLEDEDDFEESPEEKRVKLAKKYLESVGMGLKNDEQIAEKLILEANSTGKKGRYEIAEVRGGIHQ